MLRHISMRGRPACQRTAARSLQSQALAPTECHDSIEPNVISSPGLEQEQSAKRLVISRSSFTTSTNVQDRTKHRIIPFSSTAQTSWTTGENLTPSKTDLDDSLVRELLTASRSNIDVKAIILNNEEQGMVTNIQTLHYERRFAHSHNKNPDFVGKARAMGVQVEKCTEPPDVRNKLNWLLETRGPAVLEVMVAKKSLTLPMVPAGKGLDEFLFYEGDSDS